MYHIKYRPRKLEQFIGNSNIIKSLALALKKEFPTTTLFTGDSGCGKTTLARIIAKKLGASEESISELNAANTRGIDTIRDIINHANQTHLSGDTQVFIFDEAHMITNEAQNALLKITEDCPEDVYFIFCSTNPEKIIKTIRNRCIKYTVQPLDSDDADKLLKYITKEEKIKIKKSVIDAIKKYSNGSPRQILINLFKVKGLKSERAIKLLEDTTSDIQPEIIEICKMMLYRNNIRKIDWQNIIRVITSLSKQHNPEAVRIQFYSYFATTLKNSNNISQVVYLTEILDTLNIRIDDGPQGINVLIHIAGRIVRAALMAQET